MLTDRCGSYYSYARLGCRCAECRAASAKYRRDLRRCRPPLAPDDPAHGTENAYLNLACRCAECRDGFNRKANERRTTRHD